MACGYWFLLQSFVLSGTQLVFRSPLPRLLLVQVGLQTAAFTDDCQGYNGTCYPLETVVDYEVT